MLQESRTDRPAVLAIGTLIITLALIYLVHHDQTYVHIDAIAHVNKARGLWDNATPGLKQFGSIWLPLPHILVSPLTLVDILWSTGLAGSLVSAACFAGTGWFLYGTAFAWTRARSAGWLAFLLFALNPRIIYLFTTPMTEPLMVFFAAGLVYYLVKWAQTERWQEFGRACLMMSAGTLTRYEGWAIAAAAIPIVFIVARRQRYTVTVLFTGAAVFGPMLWMIYNMVYFDDPLMFLFGRGSARDYAQEYFFRYQKHFPTAGKLAESITTYCADVAYCLNPGVAWLALAGAVLAWTMWRQIDWRKTLVVVALCVGPFLFYAYNLYDGMVPLMMPGLVKDEPDTIYNVRYGMVMAATMPALAGFTLYLIFRQSERRRVFALGVLALTFLPNPIPERSEEAPADQLTRNLFYAEGVRNQSFWMPAFVEIAQRLKMDIEARGDQNSFILTNSRIVHPVVWSTAIPMKRFINEMNEDRYDPSLKSIVPEVRWVITEEGDQLWHAEGKVLQHDWAEVASAKAPSSGVVHLYRRR